MEMGAVQGQDAAWTLSLGSPSQEGVGQGAWGEGTGARWAGRCGQLEIRQGT